ncbi:hypothetical protein MTO96_022036 [Rhipicephalus appendiculatus]
MIECAGPVSVSAPGYRGVWRSTTALLWTERPVRWPKTDRRRGRGRSGGGARGERLSWLSRESVRTTDRRRPGHVVAGSLPSWSNPWLEGVQPTAVVCTPKICPTTSDLRQRSSSPESTRSGLSTTYQPQISAAFNGSPLSPGLS